MDNLTEFNFPLAVVLSAPLDFYAFPHPRPVGRMNTITYIFLCFCWKCRTRSCTRFTIVSVLLKCVMRPAPVEIINSL